MPYPFDCITEFMFVETALEPADVILVPGGSHPQLMERAADLYHQRLAPYILPSGGPTKNVASTEWEFLREVGVGRGVPQEVILLQHHGILVQKVILVCKSYHARRSLLTYQTVFPQSTTFMVCPVADKTGITKDNWYLEEQSIKKVMGELTKVGQYFAHHIPNWVRK
ncbi:hypothetical protein D3C81_1705320 [compost metagenome]